MDIVFWAIDWIGICTTGVVFWLERSLLSRIQKSHHRFILLGWLARTGRLVDGEEWTCGSSRCQSLSIDYTLGLAVFLYIALYGQHFGMLVVQRIMIGQGAKWVGGLLAWCTAPYYQEVWSQGLNAGAQYNTFPLMGGKWIPDGLFIREPWLSNLTENLVTVQFNHRYLAITTATLILVFVVKKWSIVTKEAANALGAMAVAVILQVSLGISTLLTIVWVPLGFDASNGGYSSHFLFGLGECMSYRSKKRSEIYLIKHLQLQVKKI